MLFEDGSKIRIDRWPLVEEGAGARAVIAQSRNISLRIIIPEKNAGSEGRKGPARIVREQPGIACLTKDLDTQRHLTSLRILGQSFKPPGRLGLMAKLHQGKGRAMARRRTAPLLAPGLGQIIGVIGIILDHAETPAILAGPGQGPEIAFRGSTGTQLVFQTVGSGFWYEFDAGLGHSNARRCARVRFRRCETRTGREPGDESHGQRCPRCGQANHGQWLPP